MSKVLRLIPEIRFPEFEDEGNWKTDALGNLAEIKGRIGYRGYTRADIVEEGKGAITLSPSNFEDGGSLNFEKCTYITWEKYEESPEIMLEEGQTVLVKTASVGKSAYVQRLPEKATINPQIVVLKPKKIKPRFLAYSIYHNNVQVQIKGAVGAGAIPNMSQDSISKFNILLPPDKKGLEQQKIATCLSSLDDLIDAHKDKLETLKDHKKGLLQNLFPQEGETVPKVRFPEFEGDGEWVEKKLDEISHKIMVGIASAATQAYRKSGIILFRNQNIKEGYLDDQDILFIDEEYEKTHKNKRLKAGDLLTARTGYPGTTCVVPKKYEGSQSFTTLITRPDNSIIRSDFLCLFINSEKGQSFFEATKIGGGQKNVNAGSLTEMPILYPSKKEQQKIASTLSAVDELITAQRDKIDELIDHKKGLMQGLFPKI